MPADAETPFDPARRGAVPRRRRRARCPAAAEEDQHPHPARPVVFGHRGSAGWRPDTRPPRTPSPSRRAPTGSSRTSSPKDHVLVVRHENEISQTTDMAKHPRVRGPPHDEDGRRPRGDRLVHRGLHARRAEDPAGGRATAADPQPQYRFRRREQIMTFQEVVDLARALAKRYGRGSRSSRRPSIRRTSAPSASPGARARAASSAGTGSAAASASSSLRAVQPLRSRTRGCGSRCGRRSGPPVVRYGHPDVPEMMSPTGCARSLVRGLDRPGQVLGRRAARRYWRTRTPPA